jgi:putative FmdB family regulatory protein
MPIYEYICPWCNEYCEKILPYKQDLECPKCPGEILMSPLVSVPGIQFKGNGWAKDGYATKKDPSGGGGDTSASVSNR